MMNLVAAGLAFLLIVGAVITVFAVAGAQSSSSYVDTYGSVQPGQANETQNQTFKIVTGPVAGMGIGLAFFIVVLFIVIAVIHLSKGGPGYGRR